MQTRHFTWRGVAVLTLLGFIGCAGESSAPPPAAGGASSGPATVPEAAPATRGVDADTTAKLSAEPRSTGPRAEPHAPETPAAAGAVDADAAAALEKLSAANRGATPITPASTSTGAPPAPQAADANRRTEPGDAASSTQNPAAPEPAVPSPGLPKDDAEPAPPGDR